MPTASRLSRFALFLALSLLPTLSTAQISNAPRLTPKADVVLFDFESGNFSGWTLSGDCWDKAPATPKTFTDKQGQPLVSGIVGSGYLTTLFKSSATTGKAVSKDFTIDKPFLTFKIGGGHYPKEACLNLVIDGKIVFTETGADSATLLPAYWDVYAFRGKTAHLEIVDTTSNPNRGYIMVDDLRLTETLNTPEQKTVTRMAEDWIKKYGLPGVWCAYIKGGKIVASVAVGVTNIQTSEKASSDAHLNTGSLTKPITGSLLSSFVSRRVIAYQTKIREVFPELVRQYPRSPLLDATLKQLMMHTAGLPEYPVRVSKEEMGKAYRFDELMMSLQDDRVTPPGLKYLYSYGANLAVAMVERITKTTYESWLYGDLGKSFGISDPHQLNAEIDEVTPHYLEDGRALIGQTRRGRKAFDAAGSCSLTLKDLCSFALSILSNSAGLPANIYNGNTHLSPLDNPKGDTYASWHIASKGYAFHDGNTARGEFCTMRFDVERKTAVIFYTNANYREADGGSSGGGDTGAISTIKRELTSLLLQKN